MLREIQWLKRRLLQSKLNQNSNVLSSEAHLALAAHRKILRCKFAGTSYDTPSFGVLDQPPTFHIKSGSIGLVAAAAADKPLHCVLDLSDFSRCLHLAIGENVTDEVRSVFVFALSGTSALPH